MRKLISALLALVLVLSMATVAFANDYSASLDKDTKFTKEYVVNNGEAPAETFEFEVAYESFTDNEGKEATPAVKPTVTLGTAAFASNITETATADASVSITGYETADLGVFTYKITEKAGNIAGVSYVAEPVYLKVTVLRDENSDNHYVAAIHYEAVTGDKTGKTTNEYDSGKLTVTKEITGNMADMTKQFDFTIVLTAPEGTVFAANQNVCDNADAQVAKTDSVWTVTVPLTDGESINITNIPAGTTYEISENEDGYDKTHTTVADGSIASGDEDKDVWTNELTSDVDTGITMDSVPFVLMLAVCAIAAVMFVMKRRAVEF